MIFVNAITIGTFCVFTASLFRMSNNILIGLWILSLTAVIIVGMLNYYFLHFPELNYVMLRRKIRAILNKFPNANIGKVVLSHVKGKPSNIPTIYAVCFEPKGPITEDTKALEMAAINLHSNPYDEYRSANLGLDASFKYVYKQKPEKEYIRHWYFMVKKDDSLPKDIQKEKSWKILI